MIICLCVIYHFTSEILYMETGKVAKPGVLAVFLNAETYIHTYICTIQLDLFNLSREIQSDDDVVLHSL